MMPRQSYFFHPLRLVLTGTLLIVHSGCRPEPKEDLSFEISTVLAYDQTAASNILVALERRTVSEGVFNGNYEFCSRRNYGCGRHARSEFWAIQRLGLPHHRLR